VRFLLSDADRKRLGVDTEWVELHPADGIRILEAEELDEAGYDPDAFLEELVGTPMFKDGEPVMVDVLDENDQPVVEDGEPVRVQQKITKLRAIRAAVWIAVRRGGVKAPFADFDFDITRLRTDAGEPEGKDTAETPDPPSDS